MDELLYAYRLLIARKVVPTTFVTITLKQAVSRQHGAVTAWEKGSKYRYEGIAERLARRLSREVYGNAYRRFGKLIPCVITLEGDPGKAFRYHFHALLRKPNHLTHVQFQFLINRQVRNIEWCLPGTNISPINGSPLPYIAYVTKTGADSIILINY